VLDHHDRCAFDRDHDWVAATVVGRTGRARARYRHRLRTVLLRGAVGWARRLLGRESTPDRSSRVAIC